MKPTEILSGEHRIIEQVLDCLDEPADRLGVTRAAAPTGRSCCCHHG